MVPHLATPSNYFSDGTLVHLLVHGPTTLGYIRLDKYIRANFWWCEGVMP
jgi:hypothetical protein